jgi:hypothetical protein
MAGQKAGRVIFWPEFILWWMRAVSGKLKSIKKTFFLDALPGPIRCLFSTPLYLNSYGPPTHPHAGP